MPAFLSHQIARLGQIKPLGTILHLGAGRGTEVPNWLTAGARQIVLQEPNPTFYPLLQPLCAQNTRLRLLTNASATTSGNASLHQFNAAEHSSLRAASGLENILPGLRTLNRLTVQTQSLPDIVAGLSLEADFCNVLIIDTPGIEHEIVTQLASLPKGKHFDRLFLRAPSTSLYQGSVAAPALLRTLALGGYDIAAQSAESAGFGLFHLKARALSKTEQAEAEQIKTLQLSLSQVLQECQILRSDLQALRDSHVGLGQERDALVARVAQLDAALAKIASPADAPAAPTDQD